MRISLCVKTSVLSFAEKCSLIKKTQTDKSNKAVLKGTIEYDVLFHSHLITDMRIKMNFEHSFLSLFSVSDQINQSE